MVESAAKNKSERKHKSALLTIVSTVLVAVILIVLISIPVRYGSYQGFWIDKNGGSVQYPVVLVHGLGGYGENSALNDVAKYWGVTTGDLAAYLRKEGYKVCVPTVGPFSSTWDRACELYAQLTGRTVDYGEAHSKAHGHDRFGRTYDTALVPNWGAKENGGQRVKVHLISHSFGGETIRMLTSLLAYGDAAERKTSSEDMSDLFKGGKADWVFSVTTLCAPHNGSQLTCIVDEIGSVAGMDSMTDLLSDLMFKTLKLNVVSSVLPDLMLDQFGIVSGFKSREEISDTLRQIESAGNDHAFYDLSPDGAAKLNAKIRTVDNVYYFSYAYCTTKPGKLLRGQVPESNTLSVLYPLALALGNYTGTTPGGIVIDESWQENDGLVSVVSAQYPDGAAHADYTPDTKVRRGIWYVMPTMCGDHSAPAGMNQSTREYHEFYINMLERVENLRK